MFYLSRLILARGYFVILLMGTVWADNPPAVEIPEGIHYKKADLALNDKVSSEISTDFAAGATGVTKLFMMPCVCAPAYWATIKQRPDISFPNAIKTNFSIPSSGGKSDKLVGGTLKDAAELAILAKCLSEDAGSKPVIRKLNAKEMSLLWAIYPFDLEEPIFVLENKDRHFVIVLTKDSSSEKYSVSWVDELTSYNHNPTPTPTPSPSPSPTPTPTLTPTFTPTPSPTPTSHPSPSASPTPKH